MMPDRPSGAVVLPYGSTTAILEKFGGARGEVRSMSAADLVVAGRVVDTGVFGKIRHRSC